MRFLQSPKRKRTVAVLLIFTLFLAGCAQSRSFGRVPGAGGTGFPRRGSFVAATPIPTLAVTSTPLVIQAPTGTPTRVISSTINATSKVGLGDYLVDGNGMTLYINENDIPGVSVCTGSCAELFPPLSISGLPVAGPGVGGRLAMILRSDGLQQVTYNDRPLYFYSGDQQPGDTNGQGLDGIWFAAPLSATQPTLALPLLPIYPTPQSDRGY